MKSIKSLESLIGQKKFVIPRNKANDCNPITGKPSIMVQVNAKKTYVVCGEETLIDQDVFSVLKDAGIVSSNETFEVGGPFDPVRNYDQR